MRPILVWKGDEINLKIDFLYICLTLCRSHLQLDLTNYIIYLIHTGFKFNYNVSGIAD